ncbi:hypothetical protein BKM31_14490 [[Actinomadura] parvosata subsp. kistnae]|uniref:Uncharacterized protein n=1 Tax=[Actinomadura] parvosata subsp. kistnae TaxID=1909395 RepID=A0A1U9ZX64_9ACTN|nr:hypothetical protein BKM31_14490 [Nonomuraea sp. ATCC 55076]
MCSSSRRRSRSSTYKPQTSEARAPHTHAVSNCARSRSRSSGVSLCGPREQITASTLATSAALAGRGRLLGTLTVSMRSIGLAARRPWRTAHLGCR